MGSGNLLKKLLSSLDRVEVVQHDGQRLRGETSCARPARSEYGDFDPNVGKVGIAVMPAWPWR